MVDSRTYLLSLILLLTPAAGGAGILAAQEPAKPDDGRWRVPAAGVSFAVPAGWQRVTYADGRKAIQRRGLAAGEFGDNAHLRLRDLPDEPLEKLTRKIGQGMVELMGGTLDAAEVRTIGGRKVAWISYRARPKQLDYELRHYQVGIPRGKKIALVNVVIAAARSEQFEPKLVELIASVREEGPPRGGGPGPLALPEVGCTVPPVEVLSPLDPRSLDCVGGWLILAPPLAAEHGLKLTVVADMEQALLTFLQGYARENGSKVDARQVDVAGTAAFTVSGLDARAGAVSHVLALRRGHLTYLFDARSQAAFPIDKLWRKLAQGWKWSPPRDPSLLLELGEPLTLVPGELALRIPRPFRLVASGPEKWTFATMDYRAGIKGERTQGVISVEVSRSEEPLDPEAFSQLFCQEIAKTLAVPGGRALGYRPLEGKRKGFVTEAHPFVGDRQEEPAAEPVYAAYGGVQLAPKVMVICSITAFGNDPQARRRYVDCFARVLETSSRP